MHDLSGLQHIAEVRGLEGGPGVLLDEENRDGTSLVISLPASSAVA
jgi:hypothetical protein